MFIEYGIMEDRLESILVHAGVFREGKHTTITKKIRRVETLSQSDPLAKKYCSPELLQSIIDWKEEINTSMLS